MRVCMCVCVCAQAKGSGFSGGSFTTDTDKSFGTPNLPVSPLSLKLDQDDRICLPPCVFVCVWVCVPCDISCLLDFFPFLNQYFILQSPPCPIFCYCLFPQIHKNLNYSSEVSLTFSLCLLDAGACAYVLCAFGCIY